jgi:hypothetical protein
VEELFGPSSDVVTVLAGIKQVAPLATTVADELRLMGHEKVFQGVAKQAHQQTMLIYRKEAKDRMETIRKSVPELTNVQVVENEEIPAQYNSPVVVVLGSDFSTPNIISIYGRMLGPAVNVDTLGKRVKSFS